MWSSFIEHLFAHQGWGHPDLHFLCGLCHAWARMALEQRLRRAQALTWKPQASPAHTKWAESWGTRGRDAVTTGSKEPSDTETGPWQRVSGSLCTKAPRRSPG